MRHSPFTIMLLALSSAIGCSEPRTEMIIGVVTDLPAPDMLDKVRLSVQREGVEIQRQDWEISGVPDKPYELPGSFGIYSADGSEPTVTAELIGFRNDRKILDRQAIFSLVKHQTLFLRMALTQSCLPINCPSGQTCIEGFCAPPQVDSHTLPPYSQGMELSVGCKSGTAPIDTSTRMPLTPSGDGTCPSGQQCTEGTCYQVPACSADGGSCAPAALAVSEKSADFGTAVTGTASAAVTVTLTNIGGERSGLVNARLGPMSAFAVTEDHCSGRVLPAGAACTFGVSFQPKNAGSKSDTLSLSATPGGSAVVTLTGNAVTQVVLSPAHLTVSPMKQDLGQVVAGSTSAAFSFTITNTGGGTSGTVSTTLTDPMFTIVPGIDKCGGTTLSAGAQCTVAVQFASTGIGPAMGTLELSANPGGTATATLAGTGTKPGQISITPGTFDFGTIDAGTSAMNSFTVQNTGDGATGALSTSLAPAVPGMSILGDTCKGTALSGGATCTIQVQFQPAAYGAQNITLTASATPGGTTPVSLAGIGRDTAPLTVVEAGNGSGTVTASAGMGTVSGNGISCPGACTQAYYRTTGAPNATLTAVPGTGSNFTGWSGGGCSGTAPTCTVTLSAATSVTATFTLQQSSLTVSINSPGFVTGTVTSEDGRIHCGAACSATYDFGTAVTLTAAPASGFLQWSGDCAGTAPTCTVTLSAARNVTASYSAGLSAVTNFVAGTQPSGVAIGDLNGDGRLDLAVTNAASNNVSILLGIGMGAFGGATNFAVGTYPGRVVIGDVNGDKKADLIVGNFMSDNVSILLGNGDGTFQAARNFTVDTSANNGPESVAIGDVNGDGKPDVIAAVPFGAAVLLGNGDGSFQPVQTFAAGNSPSGAAIGDLNRDGKLDLVVANLGSSNVSVLLGNGDGTFQMPRNFALAAQPRFVTVGDVNGDGILDVALADNANNVNIMLGNGDGTLQAPKLVAIGLGTFSDSIALVDMNGDHKLDLVVARTGTSEVSVSVGKGDGTFGNQTIFSTGAGPVSVAIGDLNGDGKPDVAVAKFATENVGILLNISY